MKIGPACNLCITEVSYIFSKNYEDNLNKYSTLRRTGKETLILNKTLEDMFRNLCWSTDCIFVCTDSLICLCMTGHKGYGSEGSLALGKRTRKQILLSSFPPFRFLPYSRFQFWGYSNDGRKYIEKKRKKLPFCQFIQLNQVADGSEESWRGHKGRGWAGTSGAITSAEAIQSAQAFLPTTSSLQLPGCTDNKAPSAYFQGSHQ